MARKTATKRATGTGSARKKAGNNGGSPQELLTAPTLTAQQKRQLSGWMRKHETALAGLTAVQGQIFGMLGPMLGTQATGGGARTTGTRITTGSRRQASDNGRTAQAA